MTATKKSDRHLLWNQIGHKLACPVCQLEPMLLEANTLTCPNHHCFDLAKQGYLNLLGAKPPANADTLEMVEARQRLLETGHYQPIANLLAGKIAEHCPKAELIVETGAGTGYYLSRVISSLTTGGTNPALLGIGTDISPIACRRIAKSHPKIAAIVADTWARLPLKTGSASAVICVFAPRNPAEFGRILSPGGKVFTVTPAENHLKSLRESLDLIAIESGKDARLQSTFSDWHHLETAKLEYQIGLDRTQTSDIVQMGPNAFHQVDQQKIDQLFALPQTGQVETQVSVQLDVFTPGD